MYKILGIVPIGEKIGYSLGAAAANLDFQKKMIYLKTCYLIHVYFTSYLFIISVIMFTLFSIAFAANVG